MSKKFTEGRRAPIILDKMDIHGCKGCFGGRSSQEYPCVQKDDMAQIYSAVTNIPLAFIEYYKGQPHFSYLP